MNAIAIAVHLVAATVWVGGLFFAYIVLRPSAMSLEPPERLTLWAGVFKRFFPWVWMAIIVLILSGYWLIFGWFKGFGSSPGYVHLMHLIGWVMSLLFVYLYYKIYPVFKNAIAQKDWPAGAAALNRIRHVVLVNLVLGLLLLVAVAALQRIG